MAWGEVVAKPFVTYRRADGELVYGEYAFVLQTEFFDDIDEPIELIEETWTLQSSKTITFKPQGWDELQADNAADALDDLTTGSGPVS